MLCKEITAELEKAFPTRFAMEWDNVGLLVGRSEKEVQKIYIALDLTDEVLDHAISDQADMILTHHPLIFRPLKQINDSNFIARRILRLIQNDISYYAMHTNYDVKGMADLAQNMLALQESEVLECTGTDLVEGIEQPEGIGRIGQLRSPMELSLLVEEVKRVFQVPHVKIFGDLEHNIQRVAICPGSGGSVVKEALKKRADVLVTGDIDHHTGIDAVAQGMMIVDAGHYGIEQIFIKDMSEFVGQKLGGVSASAEPIKQPFQIL